jgi:beta-xylosidase
MWSGVNWTADDYHVAYCRADSPFGPFTTAETILKAQPPLADGPGHHGFLQIPGTDDWKIVYHRRVVGDKDGNHRYLCIDDSNFDEKGNILPVVMT